MEEERKKLEKLYQELNEENTVTKKLNQALEGVVFFAPFIKDTSTGEVYFAFDEANADGEKFFKSFGDGTIGVKDDKNNDDFDDLIISLDLQSL